MQRGVDGRLYPLDDNARDILGFQGAMLLPYSMMLLKKGDSEMEIRKPNIVVDLPHPTPNTLSPAFALSPWP